MYKIIGGLLAATIVGSGVAIAAPAQASGGCVTRHEFSRVHHGMTRQKVAHIYGTTGKVSISSPPIVIRTYRTCAQFHVTNVTFTYGRVTGKLFV